MRKLLVILGPTATQKTDLAMELAQEFKGELLACDSRQVYRGLDIGTGKLPAKSKKVEKYQGRWIVDGITIWGYDILPPGQIFTVKDYIEIAKKIILQIEKNGKLPIIVGGTGLYLKALLEGMDNLSIPVDEQLRNNLEKLSLEGLQGKLKTHPAIWDKVNQSDRGNKRRLIRLLELETLKDQRTDEKVEGLSDDFDILKVGLYASREVLNKRIDERVDKRIKQGLIQEGQSLYLQGLSLGRMRELGLEYGMLADLLENIVSEDEFEKQLKTKIHQFAKRQMTWFKKEDDIRWFNKEEKESESDLKDVVRNWFKGKVLS